MMNIEVKNHIEQTPGVCGGKPRIAGHRIRVQDVAVWHEYMGMSPDAIVAEHPGLTLADVHAALAYYFDNIEAIKTDIRNGQEFVAEMQAQYRSKLPDSLRGTEVKI